MEGYMGVLIFRPPPHMPKFMNKQMRFCKFQPKFGGFFSQAAIFAAFIIFNVTYTVKQD